MIGGEDEHDDDGEEPGANGDEHGDDGEEPGANGDEHGDDGADRGGAERGREDRDVAADAGPIVGLVLGAGRGARAGGPKALMRDRDGVPLAVLHVRALEAAGVPDVVVVLRDDVARALGPEMPWSARVVVSGEPDAHGPAGSIRAATSALDALGPSVIVVSPVDKRAAPAALVGALVEAVARGAAAARPVHGGRGGHPVVVRREVLARYAAHDLPEGHVLAAPPPLRDVLHALGGPPGGLVDVPWSEEVLDDLDDPEALRRVLGAG